MGLVARKHIFGVSYRVRLKPTWPQGYKTLLSSTQLSMIFQLYIRLIYQQMKKFLALSLSDVVFIMLINVKMPTIVGIFNIYEHDKFYAQMSWAWKKFNNLGAYSVAEMG